MTAFLLATLAHGCYAAPDSGDASRPDTGPVDVDLNTCTPACPSTATCVRFNCVPRNDAGSDLGTGVARDAGACCPIDRSTSCGCVRVGGTRRSNGECPTVCGQGPEQFWDRTFDTQGCATWVPPGFPCADSAVFADVTIAPDVVYLDVDKTMVLRDGPATPDAVLSRDAPSEAATLADVGVAVDAVPALDAGTAPDVPAPADATLSDDVAIPRDAPADGG